ncbi:cupin domain-containing protein [Natrinema longum]|uniref:Cupin domain-containing protein n=1 Tax=Natrinema longum TaxID=370324 RepID=A0A8A2U9F3_9EURY|nr:cupin domain-containing protein [Natrinema longum]MBZ6494142.1 cupin domain-containing protein [Natrinema longum]QSW84528.1 cupin domain-containing protein [Natrinema longum]
MDYQVVDPETHGRLSDRPCRTHSITGADDGITFDQLGARLYVAEPGEQLPLQYHYHETQEEAFYVLSGTLNVETPERTYDVEAENAFLVEPGNPHRAFNSDESTDTVRVLAMGAPTNDGGQPYDP